MKAKRIFLIVLDSVGIGEMPDAWLYGDEGSNTLKACFMQDGFNIPELKKSGLFNIEGNDYCEGVSCPDSAYGRFAEASKGKDTTTGHWEIAGIISETPFPTYPDGFPDEIIKQFSEETGRGVLCNKPYSGTDVIMDYGKEHLENGKLIVYTSADSVFQIAAHEDKVPLSELYECCEKARRLLKGEHAVGRVIARPFTGEYPDFRRTPNRHDFSLAPPKKTVIDALAEKGLDVIPVGKIYDIFAGKSLKRAYPTGSNEEGMRLTSEFQKRDFEGLCFTNLVDFDMHYGHRNDAHGYAQALMEFDCWLTQFKKNMRAGDILFITADHGCDPLTRSTDHSREYIPLIVYGEGIKAVNLGTGKTFADIGRTIADFFDVECSIDGESFKNKITGE